MTIDATTFADLPAVDIHCHPFIDRGALDAEAFTNLASFGGGSQRYMEEGGVDFSSEVREELQQQKRGVLYFRRMVRDLAAYFGVAPDLELVLAARNAAVAEGYSDYVRDLYADANLTTLVMDFGYPVPFLPREQVTAELPVEIVPIFRIEPLIVELLRADIGWDEFERRYLDTLSDALAHGGFRGLKTIIAYRTGLEISPLSRTRDQGYQALDAIRRGLGGGSMKKLRDHLVCRALELSMDFDLPMQIHTGMGDFEVNLPLCRPSFLMDLLRAPAYRACRVILVHTGFPYHSEAAYMANVLPRVYCDVSEGVPFAGHAARRIISEVLELAPPSKVLYGSDGFGVPEINYTSAKLGRQALAAALSEIAAAGMIGPEDVREIAGGILGGNARRIYRLD